MNAARILTATLSLGLAATATPLLAQSSGLLSIGIQQVDVVPSVMTATKTAGPGKALSLQRVADSMGQQLIDRVHNTRKFKVVSRSDLETLLKEQELQSVFSDPNDVNVAQAFKMAGCKYALITTIDDFQDIQQELRAEGGQVLATKRIVRLSAVAKIYDTTDMTLLETANFQLTDKDADQTQFGVVGDGNGSDALLTVMSRQMAHKASVRVLDVIFPARVIAMTGSVVTINRGDGTGIQEGQTWNVYALGEALIDPDTGESLGSEEVLMGQVQVISVTPKFSRARVVEDYGIDKLQVLRMADS
ncbi:MAG: CsgG/HfaB family protein [Opitutales bacterium]